MALSDILASTSESIKYIRFNLLIRLLDSWGQYILDGIKSLEDCSDYDNVEIEIIAAMINKLKKSHVDLEDNRIMLLELKREIFSRGIDITRISEYSLREMEVSSSATSDEITLMNSIEINNEMRCDYASFGNDISSNNMPQEVVLSSNDGMNEINGDGDGDGVMILESVEETIKTEIHGKKRASQKIETLDQITVVSDDLFSRQRKKSKLSPSRNKFPSMETENCKLVTPSVENIKFSNITPTRLLELALETIMDWLRKLILLLLYFPSNILNETKTNDSSENIYNLRSLFHFTKNMTSYVDHTRDYSFRYLYVFLLSLFCIIKV